MKIAAFSDIHLKGKFNDQMFQKGIKIINETDCNYVICAGDLTDQGTVSDYKESLKYMKQIEKPYLIIPGNHDAMNVGDLLWEEYIGSRYFIEEDNQNRVKILGLDSTEPDVNTGWLGPKGIERIYEEFEDIPQSWFKILVFHHQTLPIPFTGRERSALNDAGDAIKAILDCNVNLVLNGHRHISNVFRLSNGGDSALIVNIGTISCKKTRYKEEYSITTLDIDEDRSNISIEVILLNKPEPVSTNKFSGNIHSLPKPTGKELMATIVQIGMTDFSVSEYRFNLDMFAKGVKLINNIECDLVVHNGNVTDLSYFHEFERAKILLQQISKPLLVVPGPQDAKPLGFELFPEYIGDMNPRFMKDRLTVLGFNTCILDEIEGQLGRNNSKLISKVLGKERKMHNKDHFNGVAFHHTIIPLPRTKHEAELTDAGDVLAMLVDNKIDLVLTGAKYRPGTWQVDDTVFVNAGTLSSYEINTKSGNSFNIISVYKTELGKYFDITEVLVAKDSARTMGQFHVKR
ncbi:MAG: metallophosphoesterase family protein [Candidatus Hodarchaeota archaeon]